MKKRCAPVYGGSMLVKLKNELDASTGLLKAHLWVLYLLGVFREYRSSGRYLPTNIKGISKVGKDLLGGGRNGFWKDRIRPEIPKMERNQKNVHRWLLENPTI